MGDLQDPTDGGTLDYVSTICLAIFSGDIPLKIGLNIEALYMVGTVPPIWAIEAIFC